MPLEFVLLFKKLSVKEILVSDNNIPHNIYHRCSVVVLQRIDYDKISLLIELLEKRSGGIRCLDDSGNESIDIFIEGHDITINKYLNNIKTSDDIKYELARKLLYSIINKREINTVILDISLINSWIYPIISHIDKIKTIVIPRFWTNQEILLTSTQYYTQLSIRQPSYYIEDRLYELINKVFLSHKSWYLTKIDHSFYNYFKYNFDYYNNNVERTIRISINEKEHEKYTELARTNSNIVLCRGANHDTTQFHTKIIIELK